VSGGGRSAEKALSSVSITSEREGITGKDVQQSVFPQAGWLMKKNLAHVARGSVQSALGVRVVATRQLVKLKPQAKSQHAGREEQRREVRRTRDERSERDERDCECQKLFLGDLNLLINRVEKGGRGGSDQVRIVSTTPTGDKNYKIAGEIRGDWGVEEREKREGETSSEEKELAKQRYISGDAEETRNQHKDPLLIVSEAQRYSQTEKKK